MVEVEEYQLAYHPRGVCKYRFRPKGSAQWSPWVEVPAGDLAAVAAVLNEKPVYCNPQSGAIFTGEEPAGP